MGAAASIMPAAGIAEVAPLGLMLLLGFAITPVSAFGVFCLGNVVSFVVGLYLVRRSMPAREGRGTASAEHVPTPRQLLGFSMWLGAATLGIAALPLVIRVAATLDSYTTVATIDIAIVLLSIPQRVGSIILLAVVPHTARTLNDDISPPTIAPRENLIATVPFVLAAIIVASTPIVGTVFDALGKPVYAKSAAFLALALLAGPARIMYGLVQGVLIAHLEGRFLAIMVLSITVGASGIIFAAAALGSALAAFAAFTAAFWSIYLLAFLRVGRLAAVSGVSAGHTNSR